MKAYLDIVRNVLEHGERKENRTGVDAITVAGAMFQHDMAEGFPLLTTKFVPFKSVATELEFFIRGLTDKKWLQDRGCTIWDEWANPMVAPYGHDDASKQRMREERSLGPVYGFQWRHFGSPGFHHDAMHYGEGGVDQLANVVATLKKNPADRRMIVSAWSPAQLGMMALPPCHLLFQTTVVNGKLNLLWYQRSVDTMLGLPFNIASYGLLLHLLANGAGLEEGKLVGFLADTHIYVNHTEGAMEQLRRAPKSLPTVTTIELGSAERINGHSIFDWSAPMTTLIGYNHHGKIGFPIAV